MNNSEKKSSVALSSVFASLFLTISKFIVGVLTGSMGIISEAAHSALDLGAAALTYFAVNVGDKPADESHPYGHGKVESVSAFVETGLLFLTSFWIIYEAVKRLISNELEVEATWYAFAVVIISIIIDISRSRALNKIAKETSSQALEADALHFSSDIWSSAVVLLGLGLVLLGIKGADAVAAIVVAIFVLYAGYRLGKRTIDTLIDTAPEGMSDVVKEILSHAEGVIGVETVRVRPIGPTIFMEIAVKINRKLSTAKADEIITNAKELIRKKFPSSDIIIHTIPIQLTNETIIDSIQILASRHNLSLHGIVVDKLDNKKFVSYDLELPGTYSIKKAHDIATDLELDIQKEIGPEIELNTHLDPILTDEIKSKLLSKDDTIKIETAIRKIGHDIGIIEEIHDIKIRKFEGKIFITLHCQSDPDMPLEKAHKSASKLKTSVMNEIQNVKNVIVHVEPKPN